jgi:hypothetical protein
MALTLPRPIRSLLVLTLLGQAILAMAGPRENAQNLIWQSLPPGAGIAASSKLAIGGATLQVDFAPGSFDLPTDTLLKHIEAAASAVTAYYGRFPVTRVRILVVPVGGNRETVQGTTWGDMHGFQGVTRLRINQHATAADLAEDWVTTHELVHMAFPALPDDQHWMEEGLATYIEPIARVETGELKAQQIWRDMVRDMPKGEPAAGDQGMDRTHTWGRTYWGGALFCLVADVAIRKETGNRKGLQDALREVVAEGGTIDHEWSLPKALEVGDRATGTHVLTTMYATWKDSPSPVDLQKIWDELGIRSGAGGVEFVSAPLSRVREAIASELQHGSKAELVSKR